MRQVRAGPNCLSPHCGTPSSASPRGDRWLTVCWEGFAVRFTPRTGEQIVRCSGLTEDNPASGSQWQPAGGEASETDLLWQCSFRQVFIPEVWFWVGAPHSCFMLLHAAVLWQFTLAGQTLLENVSDSQFLCLCRKRSPHNESLTRPSSLHLGINSQQGSPPRAFPPPTLESRMCPNFVFWPVKDCLWLE